MIHPGSLVDVTMHPPELVSFLKMKMSPDIISDSYTGLIGALPDQVCFPDYPDFAVKCVVDVVNYALSTPGHCMSDLNQDGCYDIASFTTFAGRLVENADVRLPALLVSLVYIRRARPNLRIEKGQAICERLFLAAVVIASKVRGAARSARRD